MNFLHVHKCQLKANIFYANRFLHILQKKSRNKLCLRPFDTYFLFKMFFSQVSNNFFLSLGDPLKASFPSLLINEHFKFAYTCNFIFVSTFFMSSSNDTIKTLSNPVKNASFSPESFNL